MTHRTAWIRTLIAAAACSVACAAAEPARTAAPSAVLGPLVEVTLKSGESNKGQLLSFAGGSLTLKLDSGVVVTQEGNSIFSVCFIAKEKPPTAQETQLTIVEIARLRDIRLNERKNTITKELSKEDEAEFKRLRKKTEVHINAVEREIQKAANEEDARAQLADLARSYLLYGTQLGDMKGMLKIAGDSIENESVRQKVQVMIAAIMTKIEEDRNKNGLKPNRPFDKIRDKALEKNLTDKPPEKIPEKQ